MAAKTKKASSERTGFAENCLRRLPKERLRFDIISGVFPPDAETAHSTTLRPL